jgi:inosine-uridine nucleoside N-ribohydrolase
MKFATALLLVFAALCCCAQKRLVVIDQDGAGPGGTDQMSILALLQSPNVEVLGITMVSGDQWRDEETLHTLRMLELTGHANVPVARGAVFPLVRSQAETERAAALYGKAEWLGAWGPHTEPTASGGSINVPAHGPYEVPALPEGMPTLKPVSEDAAHFLVRTIHAHPHQVTIYAAGPLTNIALAISLDPEFAALTQGIVLMGGSLNPQTSDAEFASDPRHEFNLWFDPEAAHIVLRADWPRVEVTTADVSLQAPFTQSVLDAIAKAHTPAARYIAQWSKPRSYMWDELTACAWLDPTLITREQTVYMDVDLGHGASYGDTLTWTEADKPATVTHPVHVQLDVNTARFQKMFVELMTRGN